MHFTGTIYFALDSSVVEVQELFSSHGGHLTNASLLERMIGSSNEDNILIGGVDTLGLLDSGSRIT